MRWLAMQAFTLVLLGGGSAAAEPVTIEQTFDAEEVQILKDIFRKDKLLKALSESQESMKDFNKLLSSTVPGPMKLVFKWHQAAFEGWGKANSSLRRIADARTCDDLLFPIINSSPNAEFFEHLRAIRGCE